MHGLIDSHFHLLALKQKGVDILHLLDKLFESGFQGGIDIGIRRDDLAERNLLLKDYPQIKVAAGIGPWGAQEPLEGQLEAFRALCDEEKIDALGEIGLDFYWNYGTVEDKLPSARVKLSWLMSSKFQLSSTPESLMMRWESL